MSKVPFDQFINDLLKNAEKNDLLRGLSSESLHTSVDKMLLEQSIATQFDAAGYADIERKLVVLSKLDSLQRRLELSGKDPVDEQELAAINTCIYYVETGYSLTTEIVEYLNSIHKKYE